MQVGSLVVCVEPYVGSESIYPVFKGKIYTVRDIFSFASGRIGLRFEEINNNIHPITSRECGYYSKRFRELETPKSILIEEILNETVPA